MADYELENGNYAAADA